MEDVFLGYWNYHDLVLLGTKDGKLQVRRIVPSITRGTKPCSGAELCVCVSTGSPSDREAAGHSL